MKWRAAATVLLASFSLLGCREARPVSPSRANTGEFVALMETLAASWNVGDARGAAACFTPDAVYSEPPAKQLYRGRDALYQFFGGAAGRAGQMRMEWHHLAFDPTRQVGFGEFSFTYGTTAHGVAVVRLRDGRIANWREYWYESKEPWSAFTRQNPF